MSGDEKYGVLGDFSRYLIVDRVGLDVEYIDNLYSGATTYPDGNPGLIAWWRKQSGGTA